MVEWIPKERKFQTPKLHFSTPKKPNIELQYRNT